MVENFQTVSPHTPVNRGEKKGRSSVLGLRPAKMIGTLVAGRRLTHPESLVRQARVMYPARLGRHYLLVLG